METKETLFKKALVGVLQNEKISSVDDRGFDINVLSMVV